MAGKDSQKPLSRKTVIIHCVYVWHATTMLCIILAYNRTGYDI